MTIQNVSQYNCMYSEYPIKQTQDIFVNMESEDTLAAIPSEETVGVTGSVRLEKASRTADLENISLTFLTEREFESIGKNRDTEKLDVMQAVSDMQKDSILQQYHTFVGSGVPIFSSEDGMVFLK